MLPLQPVYSPTPSSGESREDVEIYRVFRDERGYFYRYGPGWLGPLRRIDLPGRP